MLRAKTKKDVFWHTCSQRLSVPQLVNESRWVVVVELSVVTFSTLTDD